MDQITRTEALQLGIIGADGLGFVKPETAYRNINEKILAEIKKGNLVWRKGWRDGVVVKGQTFGPQNYETQRPYRGGNAFFIGMINLLGGTNFNYFLTKKQIAIRGGKLIKGAAAFPVSVVVTGESTRQVKSGEKVVDITEEYKGVIWYLVYPIDHVEGMQPIRRKTRKPDTWAELVVPDAEIIVKNMPKAPPISHGGDRAYYTPATDKVQMPHKKAFKVQQEYYSTLFHELVHSTGHKSRLHRDLGGKKGSKLYAFEELIAELGAAYLCGVCEIDYYTVDNSAAYLKNWSKRLAQEIELDPEFLKRAVFKAARAAQFIIGKSLEKQGEQRTEAGEHFPGPELKPNKAIKASINQAIQDVMAANQSVSKRGAMFLGMFYKDFNTVSEAGPFDSALKARLYFNNADLFEELELTFEGDWGLYKTNPRRFKYIDGVEYAKLSTHGVELINKISGRLHTLKAKKGGQDLFPDLAGNKLKDGLVLFLNAMLETHGRTVSREELEAIIEELRTYAALGVATAHPLRKLAQGLQMKVVNLINRLKPGESVPVQLANKRKIENAIQSLQGLGFWPAIASAVVGKGAELLAKKHIFKPKQPQATTPDLVKELQGLGFVRADDRKPAETAPESFTLPGPLGKLLGLIRPYKYAVLLTGDPHAGKTEVVCQLIDAFAGKGKKVAAYMLEQGGIESQITQEAIDRNVTKKNQENLFVCGEVRNGLDTIKQHANLFDVMVIDSWQKLGVPATRFDELRHEFPDKIFITIFQQNGQGGTRGGVSADYDTPVHLKVHKVDETFKNNYVEVKKNRGNGDTLQLRYMVASKRTIK